MKTSSLKTIIPDERRAQHMDQEQIKQRNDRTPLPSFFLIEQRLNLETSAEQVSRLLNVSRYYYYQLESGRRGVKLSMRMSLAIIKALQIDALRFLQLEAEHAEKYRSLNQS